MREKWALYVNQQLNTDIRSLTILPQEEMERKRLQQLEKKAEAKALLEQEMSSIKVGGKQPASKLTRAEIQAETERRNQVAQKKKEQEEEKPIEENINRVVLDGETACGIDEALAVLRWLFFFSYILGNRTISHINLTRFFSTKDTELDRHPEKRLKAAFTAYEERMMPIIKEQNPTLRLSQLKQILRKEWMKSPDNPLNQRLQNRWLTRGAGWEERSWWNKVWGVDV